MSRDRDLVTTLREMLSIIGPRPGRRRRAASVSPRPPETNSGPAVLGISLDPPCNGCRNGFDREEEGGKFWHVWEGRAYPCTTPAGEEPGS